MKKVLINSSVIFSFFLIGLVIGAEIIIKLGGEYYLPIRRRIISKSADVSLKLINPKIKDCPSENFAIGYFGQSNSTNKVLPIYNSVYPENLYQFHWRTGLCYEYSEPLLGTSGRNGNTITYAAIKLARKHPDKKFIIIPFGVGRSSVLDWSYGYLSYYHDFVLERIKNFNLKPKLFLWHQGESDSRVDLISKNDLLLIPDYSSPSSGEFMFGTNTKAYKDALNFLIEKTFLKFPETKFGVALVSKCVNKSPYKLLRTAQKEVTIGDSKIFISADSDLITGKLNRSDRCHFSQEGSKKLGLMYFDSIKREILDQDKSHE